MIPRPLSPHAIGVLNAQSRALYHLWAAMRDPQIDEDRRKQIRALITDEEAEALTKIYKEDEGRI